MNTVGMSLRALRVRGWVTILTLTSLALSVALPCAILRIRKQIEHALLQEGDSIDLVVGAKGSPLQLVLSTVHHLDMPTGNIPWRMVEEFKQDPRITQILPVGLGDNIAGFRIVGTDDHLQTWTHRDQRPLVSLAEGEWFSQDFEAVMGAEAAKRTGLNIGDRFVGSHGLIEAPGTAHDEFPYIVTGILEPKGDGTDSLVFTTIESVWKVHEEEQNVHNRMFGSGQQAANTELEITAVWLRLRSPGLRMWMREEINTRTEAMAAAPLDELHRLAKNLIRPAQDGLMAMAAAVIAVSVIAILSTLLQASQSRRKDWALLRILGAHPRELFWMVWLESFWMSLGSLLLGLLLAHAGIAAAQSLTDLSCLRGLEAWAFAQGEGWVLLIVFLFGTFSGLLPAMSSYRNSPLEERL